jgi:hypothetical protein
VQPRAAPLLTSPPHAAPHHTALRRCLAAPPRSLLAASQHLVVVQPCCTVAVSVAPSRCLSRPLGRDLHPKTEASTLLPLPRFPTLPHLPSVLAGQQVVGRCAGPRTLVPRARCKHVVNMGRCGHARESDLVAQISHKPLSPLFAPALLQFTCSLSLNLVSCCEARAMPCACNWVPRVMDGRAVSRGLCITHGNPASQPSYFAMVITVLLAHASLRSEACLVTPPPNIDH